MKETGHALEGRDGGSIDWSLTTTLPGLEHSEQEVLTLKVSLLVGEMSSELTTMVEHWVLCARGWGLGGKVLVRGIKKRGLSDLNRTLKTRARGGARPRLYGFVTPHQLSQLLQSWGVLHRQLEHRDRNMAIHLYDTTYEGFMHTEN